MPVTIGGKQYVAGSGPEIAPRFPGATWPGSQAVPSTPMLKALAMHTGDAGSEVARLASEGRNWKTTQFRDSARVTLAGVPGLPL